MYRDDDGGGGDDRLDSQHKISGLSLLSIKLVEAFALHQVLELDTRTSTDTVLGDGDASQRDAAWSFMKAFRARYVIYDSFCYLFSVLQSNNDLELNSLWIEWVQDIVDVVKCNDPLFPGAMCTCIIIIRL